MEEGSKDKPKRASLFSSMKPDTVTLDEAVALLSLPRVVGADAEGREITAPNGRYGPYLTKQVDGDGKKPDSRSLDSEEQLFTVTLERGRGDLRPAEAASWTDRQAADRRARAASRESAPRCGCSTAGSGPTSPTARRTRPCRVASQPEEIDIEQAVELLPSAPRGARPRRATTKKATRKKKAPAKKTTRGEEGHDEGGRRRRPSARAAEQRRAADRAVGL